MMMSLKTTTPPVLAGLLISAAAWGTAAGERDGSAPPSRIDFARQIRPILSDNCFRCHGPDDTERKVGLRLDIKDKAFGELRGGGRAIVPGKSHESELIAKITAENPRERMPPAKANKTLSRAQIELLRQWIDQGAEWSEHWAFVPPTRPAVPEVKNKAWTRNVIDRFILARLEKEGMQPSPEADRVTLIRRLTLDLTGLPPTPEEVDTFLADQSASAYEKVVERLLASPHHGERLAVDWLDSARFADTHGYHIDSGRDMTRWREYVIDAFNRNLPYDRFTIEQLAGDLLPGATQTQQIASGFNRNHMINFEGGAIPAEYHAAYIVDRVNTTATVWLGLTIGCAQCHEHKYDPISQKEYYQLYAFFHNVPENGLDGSKGNAAPVLKTPTPQQHERLQQLDSALRAVEQELLLPNPAIDSAQVEWEKSAAVVPRTKWPDPIRAILAVAADKRSAAQQADLRLFFRTQVSAQMKAERDRRAALQQARLKIEQSVTTTMVMQDMPSPRDTFVLIRGEYNKKGEKVQAGVPAFLPPLPQSAPANRLGLAQWLVDSAHPLTARVAVNRYWQLFFGTGLVKTQEDFGSQGSPPSHPELLDWLAVEFTKPTAQGGKAKTPWSVRDLVRLIVTSATYRQSSKVTLELLKRDPENRLLARAPRLRLPAEFIRDQALAASGLLNREIGGASVSPYQPAGMWQELASRGDSKNWSAQFFEQSHGKDLYRRTMYTFWKRTSPPPQLVTFDAPDREVCTVRRSRTNTPLQALILMNDPTYVEASRKLAERMMNDATTIDERIIRGFRLVMARHPAEREMAVLRDIYEKQKTNYEKDPAGAQRLLSVGESRHDARLPSAELAAWAIVGSVILNLDEVVTKN